MFEMSHSGHHHAHAVSVAKINAVLVFDGAAGLHYGGDSCFMRNLHTVREWEEGIGSHHRTFQVKAKFSGFDDGLTQRIHSGSLTYP